MKTSTEHLPPCCREELRVLRSLTVRHIPDCCLIILGGSHAGQDYVSWSESVVRGRHTLYRHDYEIAVFVEGTETEKAGRTLRRRIAGTYDGLFRFRRHTMPRFIVESIGTLAEQSRRGHLFYNGLVRDGILLYDNGRHAPCDCARPDPLRALEGAVAGFEKYFPDAVNLLYSVTTRLLPAENYRQSAGGFTRPATSSTAPYGRYIRIILPERCRSTNWADWSSVTPASSQKFSPAMTISRPKATNCFAALRKKRGAAYSATRANGWATCYAEPRRSGFSRKESAPSESGFTRSWPRLPSARKVFPGKRLSPEDKSAFRYGLPKGFVYLNSKTFPNVKKYALTLLFAFALAAMHGQDRGLPERLKRSLDSMILDAMQIKAFPGAQLVIGDREGVLYARNYGYHDYSRKREVTDRDLYDVASCTKVVSTTFVVMRLYDRGLLRIDDPLVKYLPEFAGTTAESVTLGELLTHTSGMRAQTFYTPLVRNANGGRLFSGKLSAEYPYRIGKNYFVARDVAIDTLLLSRTPRAGWREATSKLYVNPAVDTLIMRQIIEDYKPERRGSYQYSDTNFWLLKLIAEKVSGESLDRLTHALLSELGCTLSGYNPLQTCDMEHCVPTEDDHILNRGTIQGYVHDELGALMGGVGGNAGLFSTAKEMARFCEMMLNDGCYAGRRILSQETIRLFTGSPLAERKIWRGLGFDKRDPASSPLGGTDSYGHTGFTGTIFWIDARAGLYMVFLSNAVCPTRVDNKLLSTSLRTKIWEAVKQGCR